jgi:uncharacterized protein (TIGR02271 family)
MTEGEGRNDQFMALEERYAGFNVYDPNNERIGKVDDLFLDENDRLEYIGVKMGFLGAESTLIPADIATFDEEQRRVQISQQKSVVKDGPSFNDDQEITPEYEKEVRAYYGLGSAGGSANRGSYGDYYGDHDEDRHSDARDDRERRDGERHDRNTSTEGSSGMWTGDTESGEFREREREGMRQSGRGLGDEDELRVQRSEEELRAGTRERETGAMKVRKRVRTDREQIRVPIKREEVSVERVPVEGREALPGEIGEAEIVVPVVEDEVVVAKQAVVKEEIKVRKDVVHDEEIVEADVRKEVVDIEDSTERGGRPGGATGRGAARGDRDRDDRDRGDIGRDDRDRGTGVNDETRRRDR